MKIQTLYTSKGDTVILKTKESVIVATEVDINELKISINFEYKDKQYTTSRQFTNLAELVLAVSTTYDKIMGYRFFLKETITEMVEYAIKK